MFRKALPVVGVGNGDHLLPLETGDLTAAAVGGTQEAKENAKWYWRKG
jgi:hypothetical protein